MLSKFSFSKTLFDGKATLNKAFYVTVTKTKPEQRALLSKQIRLLEKPSVVPPAKALSAYNLFIKDNMRDAIANSSGVGRIRAQLAITSLAAKYKSLGEDEKSKYTEKSRQAKLRANEEYERYLNSRTPKDIILESKIAFLKKRINPEKHFPVVRDPNRPKKPPTAFLMYVRDVYADEALQTDIFGDTLAHALLPYTERLAVMAESYREINKDKYMAEFAQLKEKYDKDMKAYKSKSKVDEIASNINKNLHAALKPPKKVVKKKVAPKKVAKKVGTKKKVVKAKGKRVVASAKGEKKVVAKAAGKKRVVAKVKKSAGTKKKVAKK